MRCPSCGFDNLEGVDACGNCSESLMQEDVPQPETPLARTIMDEPIGVFELAVPICVTTGTPLDDAVSRMQAENIGYLLVTDPAGRLAGILTERDLLDHLPGQDVDLQATPVETLMTPNPTVLHPDNRINHALHLMAIQGYNYIPLVDADGRPERLLSFRRIIRFIEDAVEHDTCGTPAAPAA